MKEQLKEALVKALELAEKTGEFVIKETPEVVQQFLLYNTIKNVVYTIAWLAACILIFWFSKRLVKKEENEDIYALNFLQLFFFPGFCFWLMEAIKVIVTPKWYLMDSLIGSL